MSLFLPNIPTSSQNLDFSQGQLLSNNQGLDTVFGVDHYKFSDATVNKGFHNTVTQPLIVGSAHPATVANPILYSMQDSANLGVIQYSRGPNNAVPTPVTMLQSPAAATVIGPSSTSNVFDFTGMARALCILVAADMVLTTSRVFAYVIWTGAALVVINLLTGGFILAQSSGAILQLNNGSLVALNNVYWTLEFLRIQ